MISVVVPAYNEATYIGRVIRGLFECGYKNVVVVDDGSVDETAKVAKEAGADVIRHAVNRGQGAALQTGNEYTLSLGADYVVHFDADGQFNPADIDPALRALSEAKADVLLGSRFLGKHSNIPFFKKYFILPVGRLVNRFFTGLSLTDVHNGFRILNRRAMEKIKISQDRMAHNTDIIEQIKFFNLRYLEFPVEVTYHEYGQGFGGGVKIVRDLILNRLSDK